MSEVPPTLAIDRTGNILWGFAVRLLHTSDWHLGLTLEGMPMLDHQREALTFIADVVAKEDVDAVLISGDVYDRSLPSVEAVALFEEGLLELARLCTVIVSSGNHDSAVRLGFGSRLFSDRLHLRTSVDRINEPILLADEHGEVAVYGIPYLDPDLHRYRLGDEPLERSHEAVLGAAMSLVNADLEARAAEGDRPRSVVLAHAFIVGGAGESTRSDSERDIRVGTVDSAPASVFAGINYTALGHLHGPQEPRADGAGIVRYSGSPLRYSFSEARHTKSVTLVDLGPDGVKSVSLVEVPQPRPMAELTGTMDELLDDARHIEHIGSWVKVNVTDPLRPPKMHARLRERFEHLVVSYHRPSERAVDTDYSVARENADPIEVLAAFIRGAQDADATEEQMDLVRCVYEAVKAEEVSA